MSFAEKKVKKKKILSYFYLLSNILTKYILSGRHCALILYQRVEEDRDILAPLQAAGQFFKVRACENQPLRNIKEAKIEHRQGSIDVD